MALKKYEKFKQPNFKDIEGEYWTIHTYAYNKTTKELGIMLGLYENEQAYRQGSPPTVEMQLIYNDYVMNYNEVHQPNKSEKGQVYNRIKQDIEKGFDQAEDV